MGTWHMDSSTSQALTQNTDSRKQEVRVEVDPEADPELSPLPPPKCSCKLAGSGEFAPDKLALLPNHV